MAVAASAFRHAGCWGVVVVGAAWGGLAATAPAQAGAAPAPAVDVVAVPASAASAPQAAPKPKAPEGAAPVAAPSVPWIAIPRPRGRLRAADLGLVINRSDPYSVTVGEAYRRARGLGPSQVLEVDLPTQPRLSIAQFETLRSAIADRFGPGIQALALAWIQPSAVECNSLVGALVLGFDGDLCAHSCGRSRSSPLFDSPSAQPWKDHGVRPAMHLAAPDVPQALALIERGVAADGQLGKRGAPPVTVALLTSDDRARNVRKALYPTMPLPPSAGIDVHFGRAADLPDLRRLLMVQGATAKVEPLQGLAWLPGALADHLTSFGGRMDGRHSQTSVLDWIGSGATASYGTVSEPCNLLQKFPHPQVLLLNYRVGATAIEAYWRSVAWPQQGIFVGEPLAAPFARGL